MKAFFTCANLLMAKERRRTASKVLQYLALMLLVMQVCLFGYFLSCCHTHVNKNHNTAGMVRVRQLGWPLTSGVNLQLSLCR